MVTITISITKDQKEALKAALQALITNPVVYDNFMDVIGEAHDPILLKEGFMGLTAALKQRQSP